MKVYLSPSSQTANSYASGKTNESAVCKKIAIAAEEALKRNDYSVKRGSTSKTVSQRIAESNSWGADLHVPIHTNAGDGDGTLVMCFTGCAGNKYVKAIYAEVAALSPGKDDGIKVRTDLAEITDTVAVCVYVECEFHDDPDLANWIINHTTEIGEAIARAICKADGKTFKTASGSTGSTSKKAKYYVQCGAFADKKNADALAVKLKADGYDVYIKTE